MGKINTNLYKKNTINLDSISKSIENDCIEKTEKINKDNKGDTNDINSLVNKFNIVFHDKKVETYNLKLCYNASPETIIEKKLYKLAFIRYKNVLSFNTNIASLHKGKKIMNYINSYIFLYMKFLTNTDQKSNIYIYTDNFIRYMKIIDKFFMDNIEKVLIIQ